MARRTTGPKSKPGPKRDALGRFAAAPKRRAKRPTGGTVTASLSNQFQKFTAPPKGGYKTPPRDKWGRFVKAVTPKKRGKAPSDFFRKYHSPPEATALAPKPPDRRSRKGKSPASEKRKPAAKRQVSLAEQIQKQFATVKPKLIEVVGGRVDTRTGEWIPFDKTEWHRYNVGSNPASIEKVLRKHPKDAGYLWLHFKDKEGNDQWRSTGAVACDDSDALDILWDAMEDMLDRYTTAGVVALGGVVGIEANIITSKK